MLVSQLLGHPVYKNIKEDVRINLLTVVGVKPRLHVLCVLFDVSYCGGWINVCCLVALKGYFGFIM